VGPGCIDIGQLVATESVTLNGAGQARVPTVSPTAAPTIPLGGRNGRQVREVSATASLTAAGV
jgi:hypothetical protein